MSITQEGEQLLQHWFEEKAAQAPESETYFKYRDMIFTYVLENLEDYFSVLKKDWKKQLYLTEDDCSSIIHDGLLAAVTHFKISHESRNKNTKFLTYLTSILKNKATDYARKIRIHYVGQGVQKRERKMKRIPNSMFVRLDAVENGLKSDQGTEESGLFSRMSIDDMLERLSDHDRQIIQSILDGDTLTVIAKKLGLTKPGLRYRIRRIANKFKDKE